MKATLEKAFGYQGDNMNLPVENVDAALPFYETVLSFRVVSHSDTPHKSAVLSRDEVQIALAENGGDSSQDGCAFHVKGIEALQKEFKANGLSITARHGKYFSSWPPMASATGLVRSRLIEGNETHSHHRYFCSR
jgi:catechol 2,3-dioxygenase-like lactoylglutathione lyase family enzyme